LIKQDLIQRVVDRTGLVRTKAEAAVDTIFESMKTSLAAGERIELRGFGVFTVKPRKTGVARQGHPLQTRQGTARTQVDAWDRNTCRAARVRGG
jgi:nucleoid DNA-binding protein